MSQRCHHPGGSGGVPGVADAQDVAGAIANGQLHPSLTTLLSPFDPMVWDRSRARQLFGFDYSIECYLPAAKRRYGYFCLPLLWRGQLVGRADAKAHRQAGRGHADQRDQDRADQHRSHARPDVVGRVDARGGDGDLPFDGITVDFRTDNAV